MRVMSPARLRFVRFTASGFLSGLLLSAAGCASTTSETPVYAEGHVRVSLRSLARSGSGAALRYDHPTTLSGEQVGRILASVGVEEHAFMKWRDEGAVFAPEDVAQLAPQLAEALRRSRADQWVYFSVRNTPKSFAFGAVRFSDGIAFVQGGRLNLVFGNIGFVENVDTTPSRVDPRDTQAPDQVRLRANAPDVIGSAPRVVPGDRWLGRERTNWLVFDLARAAAQPARPQPVAATPAASITAAPPAVVTAPAPTAAPAVAATPAASAVAPVAVPADPAERLLKLKDLLDRGLITADEYEKKRQEILKGL
jgi:hypothetical protein